MAARHAASIFGEPEALPRGPHRLTREQVMASQRVRLLMALSEAVAAHGYAAATIGEISRRAGVSPRTFYEHFADKEECYLAALDTFLAVVGDRARAGVGASDPWERVIAAVLDGCLSSFAQEPDVARAFLVEVEGAGRAARDRRRAGVERFAHELAACYDERRGRDPRLGELSPVAWRGFVQALQAQAGDALEANDASGLARLGPGLAAWHLAAVRGA